MEKVIISDTTCLIILNKIGALDLLQVLFSKVTVTPEVQQEYSDPLPDWITVEAVTNIQQFSILKLMLDAGEASAITLCLEKKNSLLIIDERKGRKIAQDLHIPTIGTLGILLESKLQGHLEYIRPIIDNIQETDFRVSKELLNMILLKAGEPPII